VLETAGEREYRFAIELFRRWVRLNKPVRDVKDELDRIEPVADRLYAIGRDYFNRRQWDNAVRFFRDALTAYPRHFRARLYLGETLMEQSHVDEAIGELQQAYELDRDEARLPLARALVVQAETREKAGDEEGALAYSEKALEVSPKEQTAQMLFAAIWTRRGDAALERNELEEALSAFQKAGEAGKIAHIKALQEGQAFTTLVGEAEAHERAERWTEAAAIYEHLLAQETTQESRSVWQAAFERCRVEEELSRLFLTGAGALAQKDWKQAQQAFAEAIRHRPDYRKDGRLAASLLEQAVTQSSKSRLPLWTTIAISGFILVAAVVFLPRVFQNYVPQVVYSEDFEGPISSGWSNTSIETTPKGSRGFLGRFGNQTVSLLLNGLPTHSNVTVSFDLYVIQSWDGNATDATAEVGPDIWDLSVVNGPTLLHTTFGNAEVEQAFPGAYPINSYPRRSGATEVNTLGYVWEPDFHDSVYRLTYTFPHSTSSLELKFSALGLQELGDESWGLDNVAVRVATSKIGYAWEFETAGNSEGWQPWNELDTLQVRNGLLSTHSTGTGIDPYMGSPEGLAIDAATYPFIEIRMKVSSGNPLDTAGLLWITDSDDEWGGAKGWNFPVIVDGKFHTYFLDMSDVKSWNGTITQLRLDPVESPVDTRAPIEIDYIRVMKP